MGAGIPLVPIRSSILSHLGNCCPREQVRIAGEILRNLRKKLVTMSGEKIATHYSKLLGVFVISPLPPMLLKPVQTAGSLRSTDITPLPRYSGPIRHPLAGSRLPGFAGYTGSCSADFATGRGGFLQLLGASLSSCCRYRPARVSRRIGQFATFHAAFALSTGARPLRRKVSRSPVRLLPLRPNDSLTIPKMALLIDFIRFVSSTNAIQATEV